MPNKEVFPEYMCICVVCVLMYRYVRVVCVHVCVVLCVFHSMHVLYIEWREGVG